MAAKPAQRAAAASRTSRICDFFCRPLRWLTVSSRANPGLRGLALGYTLSPTAWAEMSKLQPPSVSTEDELAFSWTDSERQNNNINASSTLNHTRLWRWLSRLRATALGGREFHRRDTVGYAVSSVILTADLFLLYFRSAFY